MTTLPAISMFIFLAVFIGCHGAGMNTMDKPLSHDAALQLAVTLANERSMALFSVAPFDSNSYEAVFRDGRWVWGDFDPAGVNGYSANVSFDAYGMDRKIEVYLSMDRLTPVTRDPDLDN